MATSKPDQPADTVQPDPPAAAQAPAQAPAHIPTPAAGGRYTADPLTGALTLVQPAAAPSAVVKTQDPVTGVISKTLTPE